MHRRCICKLVRLLQDEPQKSFWKGRARISRLERIKKKFNKTGPAASCRLWRDLVFFNSAFRIRHYVYFRFQLRHIRHEAQVDEVIYCLRLSVIIKPDPNSSSCLFDFQWLDLVWSGSKLSKTSLPAEVKSFSSFNHLLEIQHLRKSGRSDID